MKSFIACVLVLLILPSSPAKAFDTTPPKVLSCDVSPRTLPSTGGTLTVTAQISAVNELDRPVIIRMINREYNRWIADVISVNRISGDFKLGSYTSTFNVAGNLKPDRYYLKFDPLWDKAQNSDRQVYECPNVYVDYGGYVAPTPTPSPSINPIPTTSSTKASTSSTNNSLVLAAQVDALTKQVTVLQVQLKNLQASLAKSQNKLDRICKKKPAPKGC